MLTRARFAVRAVLCVAAPLVVASSVMAGAPDASGRKPPGAGSTINPDMVYLSEGSNANTGAAIRGLTLGSDGLAGTDSQMAKAKADRDHASIVWSPDGKRYAWIEGAFKQTRSIMVSAPGETPQALYSAAFNDGNPYVGDGTDVLAWGPGCTAGTSLVVFSSFNWPSGLMAIDIAADGSVGEPRLLVGIPNAGGLRSRLRGSISCSAICPALKAFC